MNAREPADLHSYVGRWVAIIGDRVAGSGRTPRAARQVAAHNRPKEKARIAFVQLDPAGSPHLSSRLQLPDSLAPIVEIARENSADPVYLVGGAVRDAILGRVGHDLDFAVDGNAVGLARIVANRLHGDFFLLDAERGTARVILPRGDLDFASLRGPTLVDDLCDRDFTVNAIALPLGQDAPEALVDPCDGELDLIAGLIRITNPLALERDPIRCLRAVRQEAELDFEIEPETQLLIERSASSLQAISAERIRDELGRMLASRVPGQTLYRLQKLGLLPFVLPELSACQNVTQPNPPHKLDVFAHSIQMVTVVDRLLAILLENATCEDTAYRPALEQMVEYLAPYANELNDHLSQPVVGRRTRRDLLLLAGALHDVGKPATRSVGPDGRIHFYGHESAGARLASRRLRKLAFSNKEIQLVSAMVQHHLRPAMLGRSFPDSPPSRRAVFRFFRDAGPAGLEVCLLCLGDGLGKGAPPDPTDWKQRISTVSLLFHHYFHLYTETVEPPPLVTGKQIMRALSLESGPQVGRLLNLIREAQAAGQVSTPDEAIALARSAQAE